MENIRKQFDAMIAGVILSLLFASNPVKASQCVLYPRESEEPEVEICETPEDYTFKFGVETFKIPTSQFQTQLTNALRDWLSSHIHPSELTVEGSVEIWISVPETNPSAAQPRAVIPTNLGSLVFWFDIRADRWVLNDSETAIIKGASYPKSFGYRPENILVKVQNSVSKEKAIDALISEGAEQVIDQGYDMLLARTKVFREDQLAKDAVKRHSDVIKYAQVNSVMEWIADRQKAFSFRFTP